MGINMDINMDINIGINMVTITDMAMDIIRPINKFII